MEQIKKDAEFYFSEKYNLTKQDCLDDLENYAKMKTDFKAGKIKPSHVIGRGYKPQHARKIAETWIDGQIKLYSYLLENFDLKNKPTPCTQ
ncbi:MAG TPA: hypothetical protein VK982_01765 [Bacteroidales bacterium]|nr:hypothetical protein [Bacteroidales bacterium]